MAVRNQGREPSISESAIVGISIGAARLAAIGEECFESLDAPIIRITCPDTHCPFSPAPERVSLPDVEKITVGLRTLTAH